ncbi:hypothetical protein EDB89DRAFT_1908366 [Lactarius sanguifluus]|nr:hypothetical protein EDB89DRAFT_1908366 [Lactarius sanguifluus]
MVIPDPVRVKEQEKAWDEFPELQEPERGIIILFAICIPAVDGYMGITRLAWDTLTSNPLDPSSFVSSAVPIFLLQFTLAHFMFPELNQQFLCLGTDPTAGGYRSLTQQIAAPAPVPFTSLPLRQAVTMYANTPTALLQYHCEQTSTSRASLASCKTSRAHARISARVVHYVPHRTAHCLVEQEGLYLLNWTAPGARPPESCQWPVDLLKIGIL